MHPICDGTISYDSISSRTASIHIQWQMQAKFYIDYAKITAIANMKKDELTDYLAIESIDPTNYGHETFPTTVEGIRAAFIDIVLKINPPI